VFDSTVSKVANSRPVIRATRWVAGLQRKMRLRGLAWALALVDQVMVGVANLVTILLLGRLAGAESLGMFALVMTVYYLILAVQESLITVPYTLFGARLKGVRHLQYSGAALCQSAVWAGIVSTVIAAVALILWLTRPDAGLSRIVAAFALAAPFWLLREFGRRYLFAHMQVAKVVAMSMAGTAMQLMALGLLIYAGQLSAATAICAMGLGSGVAGFGWLWLSRDAFRFDHARTRYFLLKNWILGRWLLASQAVSVLSANIMPWLIVFWLGPKATGIFAACDSILRFTNPIIISLMNVLVPKAAIGFSDGGKPELHRIVWKATAVLSLFLFAFCVLLAIAGEPILNRSFGPEYAAYSTSLVVLGLGRLLSRVGVILAQGLLLLQRANILLLAEVVSFLTTLVAAALLIPPYGVFGASLSLLVGNVPFVAVIVSVYMLAMRDEESRRPIGAVSATPAPAGGAPE
jgi:O-antigen/teichoic acid export membrane protein